MKRKDLTVAAAAGVLGRMTSPKKAAAVRRNGMLGGAPPKYQPGQSVTIRGAAPKALVGQSGTVAAHIAPARYRVTIKGQDYELPSWWLRG